jgi:hypothetical protein
MHTEKDDAPEVPVEAAGKEVADALLFMAAEQEAFVAPLEQQGATGGQQKVSTLHAVRVPERAGGSVSG